MAVFALLALACLLCNHAEGLGFRFSDLTRRSADVADGTAVTAPFSSSELAQFNGTSLYVISDVPEAEELSFAVVHHTHTTLVATHAASESTAVLVADPMGLVHALVREPTRVTRIFPKGRRAYEKSVVDPTLLPDELAPIVSSAPSVQLRRRSLPSGCTTKPAIRVGVLHTAAASREIGGSAAIELDVRTAILEANAAVLPASGVNFTLELCVNTLLGGFEESNWPSVTLDRFVQSRAAARIKSARSCSIMILYSSIAGLGNSACGIGELPGDTAVVAGACFTPNFSFLHELGHNLACCHGTPPGPDCPDGRNAYADTRARFRTILAYRATCRGCPRVGRFSNIDGAFTWRGAKIGDASHNNAKTVNDRGAEIAQVRC